MSKSKVSIPWSGNPFQYQAERDGKPSSDPIANVDSVYRNRNAHNFLIPYHRYLWPEECSPEETALTKMSEMCLLDSVAYHKPLLPGSVVYTKHTELPGCCASPSESPGNHPSFSVFKYPMSVISSYTHHPVRVPGPKRHQTVLLISYILKKMYL